MVKESSILADARYYGDVLGWCIIPIPDGQKKARIQWKRFQAERPDAEQLQKWFDNGQARNLAVVLGPVSGDLCCRDFDVAEAYTRWAEAYPDLATLLPTAKTAKGYHVYFQAGRNRTKHLGDGELRGRGGYCMVPPSSHPDGPTYEWLIRPTTENLLVVDPECAGFLATVEHVTEKPEKPEYTEQTEAIKWGECVEKAICATLPSEFGTRNRMVFEFARTLKSLPQFGDADPRELRAIVQKWHKRALPNVRTKEFEETWIDFLKAWPRVQYVKGAEPVMQAFQKAVEGEPPTNRRGEIS